MSAQLFIGDCVDVMAGLASGSIDAVVCDPPYGLEFMGKQWDKLGGDAGQSRTGLGDRPTEWTSYGGSEFGGANPTCAKCGGRRRGANICVCPQPDWRVKGLQVEPDRSFGRQMQEWHERWARQAFRVLKPGGHLLAFGGTRTYHRLAVAIEDAGFEIRDCVAWMYGSGFPKSLDVSKAIDKVAGVERTDLLGTKPGHEEFAARTDAHAAGGRSEGWERPWRDDADAVARSHQRFAPATEDAQRWDGWGTALKPAFEPIVVARKPLVGTVAANVLAHGTGALNINGCRVEGGKDVPASPRRAPQGPVYSGDLGGDPGTGSGWDPTVGRWPANVVLSHDEDCVLVGETEVASNGHFPAARPSGSDLAGLPGHAGQDDLAERHTKGEVVEVWECVEGCPVAMLDAQSGVSTSSGASAGTPDSTGIYGGGMPRGNGQQTGKGDRGGASRFFYSAKTSRAERNAGLDGFELRAVGAYDMDEGTGRDSSKPGNSVGGRQQRVLKGLPAVEPRANNHPTVKPISVMRWLVRLVAPPGGVVLDPFLGSGSTGIAAALEGFDFVGIEREPDYMRIAEARIAFWSEHGDDAIKVVSKRRKAAPGDAQLDLLGGLT